MANAVANRARRPSSAESIDADLAALWRELAHEGPVSRAVMANLVVFCRCPPATSDVGAGFSRSLPITDVVRLHPSRVIRLDHDVDASTCAEMPPPPQAEVEVEVTTFGPANARYGVEQITIRSACGEAALPSIVRRLALGDVPTSVWWTEDFSAARPLSALVTMGRQLVYDSVRWVDIRASVLALAPLLTSPNRPDLADLNWRRLAPARRGILDALGSAAERPRGIGAVRVEHRPGEAALAWLLAGWIAGPSEVPEVEETASLGDAVFASCGAFELRFGGRVATVRAPGRPQVSITAPHETDAEAMASELRVLTPDTSLHAVLAGLAQRFRGA
jgi:glucose-6-phosphate dehydrogenase assembly protein OpcA